MPIGLQSVHCNKAFSSRYAMHKRGLRYCAVYVTFVYCIETAKHILKLFIISVAAL